MSCLNHETMLISTSTYAKANPRAVGVDSVSFQPATRVEGNATAVLFQSSMIQMFWYEVEAMTHVALEAGLDR